MPLVHEVTFSTVSEMVTAVSDIYFRFPPRSPIPPWWKGFMDWMDEQDIKDPGQLDEALAKLERSTNKPIWYGRATEALRSAPSVKQIQIKTEDWPYDDDEEGEEGDEGEGGDDSGDEGEGGDDSGDEGEGGDDSGDEGGDDEGDEGGDDEGGDDEGGDDDGDTGAEPPKGKRRGKRGSPETDDKEKVEAQTT